MVLHTKIIDGTLLKKDFHQLLSHFYRRIRTKNEKKLLFLPFLLLFFAIFSFIGLPDIMADVIILFSGGISFFLYGIIWTYEKDHIGYWKHAPAKERHIFIRTRIAGIFFSILTFNLTSLGFVVLGTFYQFGILSPFSIEGTILYLIELCLASMFFSVFLTWICIKHGNFLRFPLEEQFYTHPLIRESMTLTLSRELRYLKNAYVYIEGAVYAIMPLVLCALLLFVFFIDFQYTVIPLEGIEIGTLSEIQWPALVTWNLIFIGGSVFFWWRLPTTLERLPAAQYQLEVKLKELSLAYQSIFVKRTSK